jgi:hypothetical protein
MSDHSFNEFNLVGGTALALKIGHRISVDIDLFSSAPFNSSELGHHLTTIYQATEVRVIKNGVFNMVKNSLLFHDDIIFTPIEYVGSEINWPAIAERLKNSYHNPHTTFPILKESGMPFNSKNRFVFEL